MTGGAQRPQHSHGVTLVRGRHTIEERPLRRIRQHRFDQSAVARGQPSANSSEELGRPVVSFLKESTYHPQVVPLCHWTMMSVQ
jgi:hypothetical protein